MKTLLAAVLLFTATATASVEVPTTTEHQALQAEIADLESRVSALESGGGGSVSPSWDINFEWNNNIQSGGELPVNGDWERVGYNGYHQTITEGDLIDLRMEIQVTNDTGYNIGWTCYLAYILDAHSYDRTDWTYIKGTRTGQNVSPQQHHDRIAKTGVYEHVGADVEHAWFGTWCRSYSTAGQPGDVVDVDRMGVFMLHFQRP